MGNCIINRIGGGTTYSENEQQIGTWIDGKPIYRKVITYTGDIKEGNNEFKHGIQNLELIVDAKMKCLSDKVIFPYAIRNVCTNIDRYDDTKFTVWSTGDSWSSRTWAFILEYTKTTDKSWGGN